jgi:hypothetical protein
MRTFYIYVPQIFDDVYIIEAESAEAAKRMWQDGEVNYEDHFLYSTDPSDANLGISVEENTNVA